MFSNLLFLILVILLIAFAPDAGGIFSPITAFLLGMALYGILLALIYLQVRLCGKKLHRYKNALQMLVNVELLGFLAVYLLVLNGSRLFASIPQTIPLLISLCFYFAGIAFYHTIVHRREYATSWKATKKHALTELRLLLPFILPFLFLSIVLDLLSLSIDSSWLNSFTGGIVITAVLLLFLVALMVYLPFFIQKIWQCTPIEDSALKSYLDDICQKANFKHAGLKTWTVLERSMTAAIIGVVPRYRYVMFTKRLLQEMPMPFVGAVLAHEIGHSYRRHLWIYPLIIMGMTFFAAILGLLFSTPFTQLWNLGSLSYPSSWWNTLYPIALFIPYGIFIALYFRIVFGYFSRLFERQADLHIFALNLAPESLIEALNYIGIATGNSHHVPNWHHHSIQDRIDFLKSAQNDPQLIEGHHRRVKRWLIGYFCLFLTAFAILLAPALKEYPGFHQIDSVITHIKTSLTTLVHKSPPRTARRWQS